MPILAGTYATRQELEELRRRVDAVQGGLTAEVTAVRDGLQDVRAELGAVRADLRGYVRVALVLLAVMQTVTAVGVPIVLQVLSRHG